MKRRGFTLIELLVVIAIIAILIALLVPAVQKVREAAARTQCLNSMKQMGLAFQGYHDTYKYMPTGGDPNPPTRYLVGWPAQIFPYLEQGNLRSWMDSLTANALTVIGPWRSAGAPHNGNDPKYAAPISVFACPVSQLGPKSPDSYDLITPYGATAADPRLQAALHYRANAGDDSVPCKFPPVATVPPMQNAHSQYSICGVVYPKSRVRMTDIKDGSSNTILLGETSSIQGRLPLSRGWGGIQPWTWGFYNYENVVTPADPAKGWLMIDHKMVKYPIGYAGSFLTNETPYTSDHAGGGVNIFFCDGSGRFVAKGLDLNILKALATRASGEVVSLP